MCRFFLDMVEPNNAVLYKRHYWLKIVGALHFWLLISRCLAIPSIPSFLSMDNPPTMISPSLSCRKEESASQDFQTYKRLREIAVDYTPEVCKHKPEEEEIAITFDERGGARWRTLMRFGYGTFTSRIKCPDGETSGLNCSFYLSSLEGDKTQDEIDFEFLGKDKGIVQTNYYTEGIGNREQIHQLGFDCSEDFHEYGIRWFPSRIEWLIDGNIVRIEEAEEGKSFPSKLMFLYGSVWNASYIDDGRWAGPYLGNHAPYICIYKDVHVPVGSEE